jgi:hypothetical protein
MKPNRAFWDAFATVLIASVLAWGWLFYLLRGRVGADSLPIFGFLVALSLFLVFPVYYRYRTGTRTESASGSAGLRIAAMTIFAVDSVLLFGNSLGETGWRQAFSLLGALFSLLLAADYFRRWRRTRTD